MKVIRIALASALCLVLLFCCSCGAAPGQESSAPAPEQAGPAQAPGTERSTQSGAQTDMETGPEPHLDTGLDEEIQAAVDGHVTQRFWRVEAAGSFPEEVCIQSFDVVDVQTLWARLRAGLLQQAEDYTEKTYPDGTTGCSLRLDGREVTVTIPPSPWISFVFLSPKRAKAFGELLAGELSDSCGLPVADRSEEHFEGRTLAFTPELDGLPVDLHISFAPGDPMGCSGVYVTGKNVHADYFPENLRRTETVSAKELLDPEEVRQTLLFLNLLGDDVSSRSGYEMVSVYQDCQPVYRLDAVSGTVRPAWRVTGKQYVYFDAQTGYSVFPLELLVDALSGEVFVANGVSGGI